MFQTYPIIHIGWCIVVICVRIDRWSNQCTCLCSRLRKYWLSTTNHYDSNPKCDTSIYKQRHHKRLQTEVPGTALALVITLPSPAAVARAGVVDLCFFAFARLLPQFQRVALVARDKDHHMKC